MGFTVRRAIDPRQRAATSVPDERDQREAGVERREHVVVGLDAAGDLRGAAARERDGEHAVRHVSSP